MSDTGLAAREAELLRRTAQRSPEMEAVWQWLLAQDAGLPNWLDLPPADARALQDGLTRRWNAILPEVHSIEPLTVPAQTRVPCRMIVPHGAEPGCILFLHGGGWAFGSLDTHERLMRLLATATRRRVFGVEYRLAPGHPFPAPLDDACAAWAWLAGAAASQPALRGTLAFAGDSAGANLAMGVMLAALRQGGPLPQAAMLFYGAYEAQANGLSYDRFAEGYGLTRAGMRRFWEWYVPEAQAKADTRVSALRASDDELRRLPPLFLNAAGLDPLLSDTLALVERLQRIGAPHEYVLHEGVHHGFMQMSLKLPDAHRAIERATLFYRSLPTA